MWMLPELGGVSFLDYFTFFQPQPISTNVRLLGTGIEVGE